MSLTANKDNTREHLRSRFPASSVWLEILLKKKKKDNIGRTQEVAIYSICPEHRLFEREVKKEKDQLVEGLRGADQDLRLFA